MTYRTEYPRPDFVRDSFQCLNGTWKFSFDDRDAGVDEKWYRTNTFSGTIEVPFAYQAKLSGVADAGVHDILWYEKEVVIEEDYTGKDVLLHFGAVDYICDVYINGGFAGHHEGGDSPFTICMTPCLQEGNQKIVVRVYDPYKDETIPRGKQFWEEESAGIWYTPTSGIWQSVWIEVVEKRRIEKVRFISRFDEGKEEIRVFLHGNCMDCRVGVKIAFEGMEILETSSKCIGSELIFSADLIQNHIMRTNFHDDGLTWTPESPNLFDVELTLEEKDGKKVDKVISYFGFRKIHTENGMIYLNNKPYYQRLVLDQGYWPEGLLTAPTDEALKFDIEAAKKLGFNGCRKHQKAEDPRFLYWADKLGYLVWGECASIPTFGEKQVNRELALWTEIVERDFNHPSIVCWVPLNESWGVPGIHGNRQQQHYSQMLYHYLHSVDPTRLVISNDGWEMTETDICAIHNYEHGEEAGSKKAQKFAEMFAGRKALTEHPCGAWDVYAKGFHDMGAPIVLSEFGGIGFDISHDEKKAWGYTSVTDEKEFVEEYRRILDVVLDSPALAGLCYTQLTDVEQEVNGIMTYDRKWKCAPESIFEINMQYRRRRVQNEE